MDGKRIKELLRSAEVSQADLAEFLGTSPQNVNSILSSDNIKTGTLEQIARFLGKPVSFFYQGEPSSIAATSQYRVPLLPTEAHGGSLVGFEGSVCDYECEQIVSPVKEASFAIQVTGDSMAPAFPNGSRLLIQRINESVFIEWGRVYVLDTENGIIVKQVRKSNTPGCIQCCSLNPSPEFAPFEVETRYIRGWFRVLMIMSLL